ncbi:MAG TPA: HAD-IA family hydrolase [Thermoanaerobaculia bacterium]|nr:HAD-IA family hydrolase [Thermoanaerobaculia bacterium]
MTYEVITFDCYGTLIDWDRGIGEAFARASGRAGLRLDPGTVVAAYAQIEPTVQARPYRGYREILASTVMEVAARLGWPLKYDRAGFLAESLPSWPPFPDANPALRRLAAAGVRLGILSNVDEDLLAGTLRHLEASFDVIVTAQQVRSYKPAHGHFLAARSKIGHGARWLHAAQSHFHDVTPARALGIPVAWINRKQEPAGASGAPDLEFRNLTELANWVERQAR